MVIVRLLADVAGLRTKIDGLMAALAAAGLPGQARCLEVGAGGLELELEGEDAAQARALVEAWLGTADVLITDHRPSVPQLFVSDMDSTMIGQECIDELADFAGLKAEIAAITERAMQGELDFEAALRERVALLAGLDEGAIARCLAERIRPMAGARALVATLKALGCRTVLVTGGFHQFADPVAEMLGFDAVVANRLELAEGRLTGGLVGAICHSGTKRDALLAGAAALGEGATTLATGDGANDIPMLEAATYGIAYHAKPKARAAANGWIGHGDLGNVLRLLGIAESAWVAG